MWKEKYSHDRTSECLLTAFMPEERKRENHCSRMYVRDWFDS